MKSNHPCPNAQNALLPQGDCVGMAEATEVWSLRLWSFFDIGCLEFVCYCLLLGGNDPIDGLFAELSFKFLINRCCCRLEGLLVR